MMRWKYVSSKYFERASETKDEVVCGEALTLSLTVNEPQLVWKVAVQILPGSSDFFGGLRSRLCDLGLGTFGQPLAGVAAVSDSAPRPPMTTARFTVSARRGSAPEPGRARSARLRSRARR